jgi:hypothetical protein
MPDKEDTKILPKRWPRSDRLDGFRGNALGRQNPKDDENQHDHNLRCEKRWF